MDRGGTLASAEHLLGVANAAMPQDLGAVRAAAFEAGLSWLGWSSLEQSRWERFSTSQDPVIGAALADGFTLGMRAGGSRAEFDELVARWSESADRDGRLDALRRAGTAEAPY